jgi:hypothetical protein
VKAALGGDDKRGGDDKGKRGDVDPATNARLADCSDPRARESPAAYRT